MITEPYFRWLVALVFLLNISISGFFRHKARMAGETIKRSKESTSMIVLRLFFALPLFLSIVTYMLNPQWMAWSSFVLPMWLRLAGAGIGLCAVFLLYWVMRSIGSNISETVLTKSQQRLVTHGPYRWVRHPLYSTGTLMLISIGLIAANWLILFFSLLAVIMIVLVVIPREEQELVKKFEGKYIQYRKRTGKILPRLRR